MRFLFALLASLATPVFAEVPVVIAATATRSGESWRFEVTLTHPDTGWDHYADAWEILAPDGTVIGTRVLDHPHETEQPFTRSLAGVTIAPDSDHVTIRARCLIDGWGPATFRVVLRP